jgi:hypothetical protein
MQNSLSQWWMYELCWRAVVKSSVFKNNMYLNRFQRNNPKPLVDQNFAKSLPFLFPCTCIIDCVTVSSNVVKKQTERFEEG